MLVIFSSTIGNILWVCLVASLVLPYVMKWRRKVTSAKLTAAMSE